MAGLSLKHRLNTIMINCGHKPGNGIEKRLGGTPTKRGRRLS
jgi:hypothetical protein